MNSSYRSERPTSKMPPEGKYPPGSRLFIGNLDTSGVSRKEVKKIFEKYGKLQEEVRFHKGFCFIQYETQQAAQAAIDGETGKQLGNRIIEVEPALGRKSKEAKALGKRPGSRDEEPSDGKRRHLVPPVRGERFIIPVFVLNSSVLNYAYYVRDTLHNALSSLKAEPIVKQEENAYQSLDRALKDGERYTILLNKKNENQQTVSFRAVNPDGTSPGFADTLLTDVIQYILKQESPQQNPYNSAPQSAYPPQAQAPYPAASAVPQAYDSSAHQQHHHHHHHGAAPQASSYGHDQYAAAASVHHPLPPPHHSYVPPPANSAYSRQAPPAPQPQYDPSGAYGSAYNPAAPYYAPPAAPQQAAAAAAAYKYSGYPPAAPAPAQAASNAPLAASELQSILAILSSATTNQQLQAAPQVPVSDAYNPEQPSASYVPQAYQQQQQQPQQQDKEQASSISSLLNSLSSIIKNNNA